MLIGIVAAACTTLAFLPQLFKIEKEGSTELSTTMLGMYVAGQILWLAYGFAIAALPVIGANAVSIVLVSAVAIRKGRAANRTPRRLRIAIDMDEVMADALSEHLRRYNGAFDAQVTPDDLRGRHIDDYVPAAHRAALDAMLDETFFADLAVMPGCQEVVRELAGRHDVFVVTAAMDVPCSFDAKYRWLQRHFPFIAPSNVIFCGDKSMIDADYLIDDRPRHFGRFKGRGLLFSAPHNAGETRYPRVGSWAEVRRLFRDLEAAGSAPRARVVEARA
jgi:5'(3')-deoxyribonucleotidase/uncharacterized protein with PQ loop repeat